MYSDILTLAESHMVTPSLRSHILLHRMICNASTLHIYTLTCLDFPSTIHLQSCYRQYVFTSVRFAYIGGCLQQVNLFLFAYRRHSGEEAVEEDDSKKSKRHRSDKDRSSDKRDDEDRSALQPSWSACLMYRAAAS